MFIYLLQLENPLQLLQIEDCRHVWLITSKTGNPLNAMGDACACYERPAEDVSYGKAYMIEEKEAPLLKRHFRLTTITIF